MIPIYPVGFPHNIDQNSEHTVFFKTIHHDSPVKYFKRTGYCNKCGDCCIDVENVFATHDGDGNPGGLVQSIPGMCAYLKEDGLGHKICTGRNTNYYKNGCSFFPAVDIKSYAPNCSFNVEEVDKSQVVEEYVYDNENSIVTEAVNGS